MNTLAPLLLTVDFELTGYEGDALQRFPAATHDLLDWFERHQVQATFFCVGELLERFPELVHQIAARGHEIACHGWRHIPLTELDPRALQQDLSAFQQCAQRLGLSPVEGYRAPFFSLTPATAWALDVIREAGFVYDSSAVPARTLLHGYPAMGQEPRRLANGLLEIPVSVLTPLSSLGCRWGVPALGGTYLRLLPPALWLNCEALRQGNNLRPPMAYLHPYDLDRSLDSINAFPGNPLYNALLKLGRGGMPARIERLLEGRRSLSIRSWREQHDACFK